MTSMGKTRASRRAFMLGGIATGALLAAGRAFEQARAAPSAALTGVPPAPRDDTVDVLHGVTIPDPFRPLEDYARPDVQAWIGAEDERARAHIDALAMRKPLRAFIDAALDYPRTTVPARYGSRYFTLFNDGLADQRSLGVEDHLGGPRRTLIDAGTLSTDGTVAIAGMFPDRLGTKVAYLLSAAGSDQQTLRLRDVETGEDLPDTLAWCKHTTVAWSHDGQSFFYARYPGDDEPADWYRRGQIVCLHRLGKPQSADQVIFRLPGPQDVYFELTASWETDLLKIVASIGTSEKQGYFIAPMDEPARLTEIFPIGVAGFEPVREGDTAYYALTNLDAPKWRLVRIDPSDPKPDRWRTVVPESDAALSQAAVFEKRIVVKHLADVNHRISTYDLDGERVSTVDLGGLASVQFGRHYRHDDHLLLEVNDYKQSSRIERLDLAGGKTTLLRAAAAKHDLSDAVVRQVFVKSKDGTRVPMTLIHRPGISTDGNNRTLLWAYGGFGYAVWPYYRAAIAAWVRLGGVYAVAYIRGGGEYGQTWHDDGRLANKQSSFDDFIASAEWLIANGYTRPERLGSNGVSNGGLLVLATMLERPDLFGAVVSAVPVTDMLRFPKFTFGINWTPEYGDPTNSEADFRTLLAYSPLHNVRRGAKYPPLLVLTADHDDRVAPAHSYKFVATMQSEAPECEVYLRVERQAGHGDGNALSKSIDRDCDTIAFLCEKLGGPMLDLPKIDRSH